MEKLISLLGGQYYPHLTRMRSLLLVPEKGTRGQKVLKAREWDIPVVEVGWLWEVISSGNGEVDFAPWCQTGFEGSSFLSLC